MNDRNYDLIPHRADHQVTDRSGNYAIWDDGVQTYTLQWSGAAHTGWETADWADTLVCAVDAIKSNPAQLTDPEFVSLALTDIDRLSRLAEAVADELLKAARTEQTNGEALLSWQQIGDAQNVNRSTPKRRYERLEAGETSAYSDRLTPPR